MGGASGKKKCGTKTNFLAPELSKHPQMKISRTETARWPSHEVGKRLLASIQADEGKEDWRSKVLKAVDIQ